MSLPRVSVVIPCYNAAPWIAETLQSVVNQAATSVEIILVDDGSTDGSAELVHRLFPAVRIARTRNEGPSRARNFGTSISNGEFIQYLDADDLLAPGKLDIQLRALATTGADVAYGDWQKLVPSGDGVHVPGHVVRPELGSEPELALFTDFWCPPAAYLFRRSVVEKVGGWSETLPIIQDARFALDCALAGGQFVRCSGIMAAYRVHRSGSVSTRDPQGFVRDCLQNATEIEERWQAHGGITAPRREALCRVYGQVARGSFERDRPTFEVAFAALERISPGYRPDGPKHFVAASYILGYRRAEVIALWYRRARRWLARPR